MLRLLGRARALARDIYHYVVRTGSIRRRGCSGCSTATARLAGRGSRASKTAGSATGHALLVVRTREETDAVLGRAMALESERRLEEAEALYREVLEVRPDSLRAWVDLGNVVADRGRRADAEAAYRRAPRPSTATTRDALNNLAWLLLEGGARLEDAGGPGGASGDNPPGPDRSRAQDTLGRIQLARGRCVEAERTFREALEAEALSGGDTRAKLLGRRGSRAAVPAPGTEAGGTRIEAGAFYHIRANGVIPCGESPAF
jgi:tetratricopeptide (TPR) repeat protein